MEESHKSAATRSVRIPVLMTASERWRRRWGRRLIVWGVLFLVLSSLGVYLGPFAYKAAKRWRAHKLLEFAVVQKNGKNETEMRSLLLRAFLLDGNDDVVLRTMAQEYANTPIEKLQFLQKLSLSQNATMADRLLLCRVAIDNRLTSFASADFDRIMADPESRKNPETAELCARYLTLQGQWAEALKWTSGEGELGSAKGEPVKGDSGKNSDGTVSEHPRLNIIRAKLLLDAPQPDQRSLVKTATEVTQLLQAAIAKGSDKEKREAVLLLARIFVTTPSIRQATGSEAAEGLLKTLEKWSSEPKWEARLVGADLGIFLKPGNKNQIVNQLLTLAPKVDDATQQELARWLTRRNEPGHAQGLSENGVKRAENREWFLIRMDAMASQKKWKEIETILLTPKGVPIEEAIGRLFLWRCAKEMKSSESLMAERLDEALEACKNAPLNVSFYCAGYLEQVGEKKGATAIYRRLTDNEASAGPAYVGLVRCLGADPRQSTALREALEGMLAKFPNVKEGKNDLAYLNLLENRQLPESIRAVGDLVVDAPHMLAYRTSLALSELVQGKFKAADSVYRGIELDWTTVNPGWVAVRAAVLGANGQKDEARLLVDPINPDLLRDGEKKLLDRYVYSNSKKAPEIRVENQE